MPFRESHLYIVFCDRAIGRSLEIPKSFATNSVHIAEQEQWQSFPSNPNQSCSQNLYTSAILNFHPRENCWRLLLSHFKTVFVLACVWRKLFMLLHTHMMSALISFLSSCRRCFSSSVELILIFLPNGDFMLLFIPWIRIPKNDPTKTT